MELKLWGLDKIAEISDRYRSFSRFLTEVLEGENQWMDGSPCEVRPAFKAKDDWASLEPVGATPKGRSRLQAASSSTFFQLAPFFEAGFRLETKAPVARSGQRSATVDAPIVHGRKRTVLELKSMFLAGQKFTPDRGETPLLEVVLPSFEKHHVYRARIEPVLRLFRLETLRHLHQAEALAFSPRQGEVVILICNRPLPWQISVMEKVFNFYEAENSKGLTR